LSDSPQQMQSTHIPQTGTCIQIYHAPPVMQINTSRSCYRPSQQLQKSMTACIFRSVSRIDYKDSGRKKLYILQLPKQKWPKMCWKPIKQNCPCTGHRSRSKSL